MRKLVLTIAIGEDYEKMGKLTHPLIKKYAEKIGAEFLAITKKKVSFTTPHWEKFQIFDLLNTYDRILYIDTDIIIRDDAPDLFDIVPFEKLGMFNEAPFTDRSRELLIESCKQYNKKLPNWNGKYFNSGVMVISKQHKELFRKPEHEFFNFYEQTYLNVVIAEMEIDMFELEYRFNRMTCLDNITGRHRLDSYFVHYAGYPNINFVLDLIPKDIAKWERDKPRYKYTQHIHIIVSGGMGDQMDAEPAVRFFKEKILPEAEISVSTHHPRLFNHLKEIGIQVFEHSEFSPKFDTPYRIMQSFPDPTTVTYSVVSNLLCHTVDYCSIALLKRLLPFKDRNIKLNYSAGDLQLVTKYTGIEDLSKYIVVHPGKHWESKTMPVDYWQSIIDSLVKAGEKVIIIGKEEPGDPPTYIPGARGTVDVKCPDGAIDLRNKLDTGALIALLARAKILVSNDSAPIHLAGAFDNWIVVLPTCKHPDHILPYRNGSVNYKTMAFYKKLVIDDLPSSPTEMNPVSAGELVDKWENYLVEPEKVVNMLLTYVKK